MSFIFTYSRFCTKTCFLIIFHPFLNNYGRYEFHLIRYWPMKIWKYRQLADWFYKRPALADVNWKKIRPFVATTGNQPLKLQKLPKLCCSWGPLHHDNKYHNKWCTSKGPSAFRPPPLRMGGLHECPSQWARTIRIIHIRHSSHFGGVQSFHHKSRALQSLGVNNFGPLSPPPHNIIKPEFVLVVAYHGDTVGY